jgi:hypothetical protein
VSLGAILLPVLTQQHSFYSSISISFLKVSLLSPQVALPVIQDGENKVKYVQQKI